MLAILYGGVAEYFQQSQSTVRAHIAKAVGFIAQLLHIEDGRCLRQFGNLLCNHLPDRAEIRIGAGHCPLDLQTMNNHFVPALRGPGEGQLESAVDIFRDVPNEVPTKLHSRKALGPPSQLVLSAFRVTEIQNDPQSQAVQKPFVPRQGPVGRARIDSSRSNLNGLRSWRGLPLWGLLGQWLWGWCLVERRLELSCLLLCGCLLSKAVSTQRQNERRQSDQHILKPTTVRLTTHGRAATDCSSISYDCFSLAAI